MATIDMHMKFEIEIPKQTWLMLRKPCRLQTDRRTDGQTDKVNPVYPPPTSLGGGIKIPTQLTCRISPILYTQYDRNIYVWINDHGELNMEVFVYCEEFKAPRAKTNQTSHCWPDVTNLFLVRTGMATLRTRFVGPAWGPPEDDTIQVGPMLAPWNLLFGYARPTDVRYSIENLMITDCTPTLWHPSKALPVFGSSNVWPYHIYVASWKYYLTWNMPVNFGDLSYILLENGGYSVIVQYAYLHV